MNDIDPASAPAAPIAKPLPIRSGPWHLSLRWLMRIAGLFMILPLVGIVVLPLLLVGQEVTAPSWLRVSIEQRAAAVLDGGTIAFGAITVTVGSDLHPRVRLTDAVLRDADNVVLARVPEITALLSPRGLILRREVLAQEITLTGAEVSLRRDKDGRVALAFGAVGPGGDESVPVRQATGFVGLLEQFDQAFERPALAALEQVRIQGLVINFDDVRAGRSWVVDGGELALDLRDGQSRLTGDMSLLSGRSFVTRATLSYESPRGSLAARIGMTVSDAAARDIAMQSPALNWLRVLDAPISAAFRVSIDEEGQLGPLSAALKIAAGALAPQSGARPVAFDNARAYLSYDPATGAIQFDQVEVKSDWGSIEAEGEAYLRDVEGGLPRALLGQFRLSGLHLNPDGLYPGFLDLPEAFADFRLELDPFRVTFGNISLTDRAGPEDTDGPGRLTATGEVSAASDGWTVGIDLGVDHIATERVMAFWPIRFKPLTRMWFAENVEGGDLFNVSAALRLAPGAAPVFALTQEFRGMNVRPMRYEPPITGASGHAAFEDFVYSIVIDQGRMTPPEGGTVDIAGSSVVIHDTRQRTPPTTIRVRSDSTITAALSVLDQRPFRYVSMAGLPVTLADGRARVTGEVNMLLGAVQSPGSVDFDLAAQLTDVRTEVLVPGRVLAASALEGRATNAGLELSGPMRLGQVAAQAVWRQPLGAAGAAGSVVEAEVELSERFIDEFGIGLPAGSVSGAGTGQVRLTLPPGEPPAFTLTSDLRGVGLRLPGLGWSKGPGTAGTLEVAGVLGLSPRVDRIDFDAAGLSGTGNITLDALGGLDRATFNRVSLGGWFDAPVTLIGRGPTRPVGVDIGGGVLNLALASFTDTGEAGGPMEVALDRLRVTDSIALTDFRGSFAAGTGLSGQFTAKVNGGPPVTGTVVPQPDGAAIRIRGEDAGAILGAAGLLSDAEAGSFDMTLIPQGTPSTYDGSVRIGGIRVHDAPVLASLLNAISVFGLLQQMGGQGLVFDDVRADFRIDPNRITVTQSSAVGLGLGISLDGFYTLASGALDFQGVLSPLYVLNAVGQVLTRRGEGLIGFSFNLGGTYENMAVSVNPFSVLTPGMFREMFRRPVPTLGQ